MYRQSQQYSQAESFIVHMLHVSAFYEAIFRNRLKYKRKKLCLYKTMLIARRHAYLNLTDGRIVLYSVLIETEFKVTNSYLRHFNTLC